MAESKGYYYWDMKQGFLHLVKKSTAQHLINTVGLPEIEFKNPEKAPQPPAVIPQWQWLWSDDSHPRGEMHFFVRESMPGRFNYGKLSLYEMGDSIDSFGYTNYSKPLRHEFSLIGSDGHWRVSLFRGNNLYHDLFLREIVIDYALEPVKSPEEAVEAGILRSFNKGVEQVRVQKKLERINVLRGMVGNEEADRVLSMIVKL